MVGPCSSACAAFHRREERAPDVRKAAIHALGNTEHDAAVDVLVRVARSNADVQIRKAAVAALGQIGTPRAQEALLKILQGEDN